MSPVNPPLPSGLYDAVLESWQDLGLVRTPYGELPKVEFRFRIQTPHGKFVVNQRYGHNFARKSHLSRDIENLLGEFPGPCFDLGRLVGLHCQVNLALDELGSNTRLRIRGLFPAREPGLDAVFGALRRYAETKSPCK